MVVALPIVQTLTMVKVALDRPPSPQGTYWAWGREQGNWKQ